MSDQITKRAIKHEEYLLHCLRAWKLHYRSLRQCKSEDETSDKTCENDLTSTMYSSLADIKKYGIFKFNKNPTEGIAHLIHFDVIKNDSYSVARFLVRNSVELRKSAIGQYISINDDFHGNVLAHFMDLIDLQKMSWLEAIRELKFYINFPDNDEGIEIILQAFIRQLRKVNKDSMPEDVCLVLLFSIIVLNEFLGKDEDSVPNDLTVEQFINYNDQLNYGKNFEPCFLENIYNSIYNDRLSNYDMEHVFMNTSKKGHLYIADKINIKVKKLIGNRICSRPVWTKELFYVYDDELYLFTETSIPAAGIVIPLKNLEIHVCEFAMTPFCFQLFDTHKNSIDIISFDKYGNAQKGTRANCLLKAENEDQRNDWIRVLIQAKKRGG